MIKDSGHDSFYRGELANGCKLCMVGRKTVILSTGICPRKCFYCPLSEQKKDKDVTYVNEIPLDGNFDEIIEEVKICSSRGAGITGGDPLARLDRTISIIKMLKEAFGKDFHIHLYTSFDLANKEKLKRLYDAGLDEIRFHPDFLDNGLWRRIHLALDFDWDVGIEIPVIPKYRSETYVMLDYFIDKVKFVNLNELEISTTNEEEMMKEGIHIKENSVSSAVGSIEFGKELLKKYDGNIHLCTARLKDAHQMKNRLILRANNIAGEWDIVTEEGLLKRGVIYLNSLYPSLNYKKKLDEIRSISKRYGFYVGKLNDIKKEVEKYVPCAIDYDRMRILVPLEFIDKLKKKELDLGSIKYGWVEEYPTYDHFEIELEILN